MLYTDDKITEYKQETVDNVKWHDEMTQKEINIMTDACESVVVWDIKTPEKYTVYKDLISREKALNTVEHIRKVCDTDDIDDYYELLKEAFRVLV